MDENIYEALLTCAYAAQNANNNEARDAGVKAEEWLKAQKVEEA